MQKLVYDIPVEVTARQYSILMNQCAGCVAGRTENGKYFIKPWLEITHVQEVLQNNR